MLYCRFIIACMRQPVKQEQCPARAQAGSSSQPVKQEQCPARAQAGSSSQPSLDGACSQHTRLTVVEGVRLSTGSELSNKPQSESRQSLPVRPSIVSNRHSSAYYHVHCYAHLECLLFLHRLLLNHIKVYMTLYTCCYEIILFSVMLLTF